MSSVAASIRVRRFISVALFQCFLVAVVSGVVLFLRPEGSLARWAGWAVLGIDKKQWESVHTVFVVLALAAAVAHIAFNWRALVASLFPTRQSASSGRRRLPVGVEWVGAAVLAAAAFWVALGPFQPAAGMVAVRTLLKDGRFAVRVAPPAADADRLSVGEVCRVIALGEERAIANARSRGIRITDSTQTLAGIAQQHGVSPEAVYVALRGD